MDGATAPTTAGPALSACDDGVFALTLLSESFPAAAAASPATCSSDNYRPLWV